MDDHAPDIPNDTLATAFAAQRDAARLDPMPTLAQRRTALDTLAHVIRRHEQDWVDAISADFGHRASYETRLLEWLPLLDEAAYLRRRLPRLMRPRRVSANWNFLPSRARLIPQPLGVVGVIGAWNYPLQETLSPALNALAAGNRVLIKPSEHAPVTAELLRRVLANNFDPGLLAAVTGDATVSAKFSALAFDHLIFTGSGRIGRKVMMAAANHLTPVTLELGGKSPAIVHADYPIDTAADRIASAKFWNAGQTCIAPDYVLVPEARMEAFGEAVMRTVERRWPAQSRHADYTHMISLNARERMQALVEDATGRGARLMQAWQADETRSFPPTALLGAHPQMQVMEDEIFGPLLPVIGYRSLDEALDFVRNRDRPLALYYFDHDAARVRHVLSTTHAGGVTVNDCIFHFAQHRLPFGGVGSSGMGAYHGDAGFHTFSHLKPVLMQNDWTARILARLIRPPYGEHTRRVLRWLSR